MQLKRRLPVHSKKAIGNTAQPVSESGTIRGGTIHVWPTWLTSGKTEK